MAKLSFWLRGLVAATVLIGWPAYAAHIDLGNIQPGELALVVDDGTVNPDGTPNTWGVMQTGVNNLTAFDINKAPDATWGWSLEGTIAGDADPLVTNNLVLRNMMSTPQTYLITQLIGISPAITPTSLTSGSIGGSITDNNNNGATLTTTSGTALYTSLIDGSVFVPLLNDPFSVNAVAGGSQAFPLAGGNFGLPGPSFPGPAANSTIGIQLSFTLTPGDSVSFTSNFQVVPIPAAAWLFGSGLIGLIVIARRKTT